MLKVKHFFFFIALLVLVSAGGCGSLSNGRPEPPYDADLFRKAINGAPVPNDDVKELLKVDGNEVFTELVKLDPASSQIVTKISEVFTKHNITVIPAHIDRIKDLLTSIKTEPSQSEGTKDILRRAIDDVKSESVYAAIQIDTEKSYPRIIKMIQAFYATPKTNSAKRQDLRDEIMDLSLTLINVEYAEFTAEISSKSKGVNASSTILSIGADAAATLVSPASTVRILAAISGGIEASRMAINKEYLYEQTIKVLISQMTAQRTIVFQDISTRLQLPIDQYTMAQALNDIDRYYNAGTIDGAFAVIQKNASTQQQAAEERSEEEIRDALKKLSQDSESLRVLFAKMQQEDARELVAEMFDVFKQRYSSLEYRVQGTVYSAYVVKDDSGAAPVFHYTNVEVNTLKLDQSRAIDSNNITNLNVDTWIKTLATLDQLATLVQSEALSRDAPAFVAAVRAAAEKSIDP